MKLICELIGVAFDKSFLSWKSYELLDPNWEAHDLARASEKRYGWFRRANMSAPFLSLFDIIISTNNVFFQTMTQFSKKTNTAHKISAYDSKCQENYLLTILNKKNKKKHQKKENFFPISITIAVFKAS